MIIAGLLFLYADIFVGGVDFLPDLLGYILIFIAIFKGWLSQKKYPSRLLIICIITAALCVFAGAERSSYVVSLIFYLLLAIGQLILVWQIYGAHRKKIEPKQKTDQDRIMQTALALILICELCSPVLSIVPVLPYVINGLKLIIGIGVSALTQRIIKASK